MRKKRENGRECKREGTRERGIITTITLPPWDRFREEEKGEEEDEDEKEEEEEDEDGRNDLVVANERHRTAGKPRGKPRCAHREHLILYLRPSAMIFAAFCFIDYEKFYMVRTILIVSKQKRRNSAR